MLDASVESFSGWILSESKDVTTADAGQPAGPGNQQEAQGPHAAQDVGVGPLARSAPWGRDGVELEAAGDVVGKDAELLPGTVGPVVPGRDDVERESPLSSAIVFSWAPRPPMNA